MKSLDRAIKRERHKRYRLIKKLFKARDAASEYVKTDVKISVLKRFLENSCIHSYTSQDSSTARIAKRIVDRKGNLIPPRPPAPLSGRASITKPSMTILPTEPKPLVRRHIEKE